MLKKCLFLIPLAFLLLGTNPVIAADVGILFGTKWSSLGGYPTTVGIKMVEQPYSFSVRGGLYHLEYTGPMNEDLTWMTLGGTFDYYLDSEGKLKPYAGSDLDLHFWDFDSTEVSLALNPHFGVEYWLEDNFSLSGEVGLGLGLGEVWEMENRIATTTAINLTYYF